MYDRSDRWSLVTRQIRQVEPCYTTDQTGGALLHDRSDRWSLVEQRVRQMEPVALQVRQVKPVARQIRQVEPCCTTDQTGGALLNNRSD